LPKSEALAELMAWWQCYVVGAAEGEVTDEGDIDDFFSDR
jgi:hypothetical protein